MPAETLLTARGLVLRFHDRVLLAGASLSLAAGDRVGLVGRNGTGKSTFLRILAGELPPDGGEVARARGIVVGYLPQAFELDPAATVFDVVQGGARPVLDLIAEFEALPGHTGRHDELEAAIHRLDGWTLDSRIRTALSQLHCPPDERRVGSLSGGERRRVALARALVGRPDVLILDEPTNHLDAESVAWMTEFLAGYAGALLVVTHDRHFLDEVATGIVELRHGVFERHEGNYTDYLAARAEKLAAEEVVEHKRQMFLRKELDWVRRQPKAQTSKSKARLDKFFAVEAAGPPAAEAEMDLVIPPPPPLGNRVVELSDVGVEFAGRRLFSGLNLTFAAGSRVGITGRNGLGKTTLLRVILGEQPPTTGEVRTGPLTRFNYVDQGRLQLHDERTVLEEIGDGSEWVKWGEDRLSLRGYLKRFLFTDERITTQVKHLSGGERSRLLLARVLKRGGNFLILDEPTNDLDLPTMRVLEEALATFPGCVLVVSHDRYFLNRVCNGIIAFEGGGRVTVCPGNYDYYVEKRREREARAAAPGPAATAKPAPGPAPPRVKPRRLTFKEQRELEGMEDAIHAAEAEAARLEAKLAEPEFFRTQGGQVPAVMAALDAAKAQTARLYQRWEELEALRTAAEAAAGRG